MDFLDLIVQKKLIILIISLIINLLLFSICGFLLYDNLNYECINDNKEIIETNHEDILTTFFVEVKGAVKKPGVYEVSSGNIINDVINMAEGFTKKAYTKNINLSKKVSNELVIYVYTESEFKKLEKEKSTITEFVYEECICPSYDISDCISNGSSEITSESESTSDNTLDSTIDDSNTTKLININTATKEVLMTLSGVGESKANSIIEYRSKTKFSSIEDIKNVSGIGEAAFEKIKDYITV